MAKTSGFYHLSYDGIFSSGLDEEIELTPDENDDSAIEDGETSASKEVNLMELFQTLASSNNANIKKRMLLEVESGRNGKKKTQDPQSYGYTPADDDQDDDDNPNYDE